MSHSPSYQRESASASPESPKEGDFSPRQLYDNLKSLEEYETCDDQKDPIVNIITDNCSGTLLHTQMCAPPVANDLGKLDAGILPQEQPIMESHLREPGCLIDATSPLQEKFPVSPEFMEVLALDGRFITLVNAQTQTDWEWVEQSLSFSCQVQKEIEDPQLLQAEVEPEDEKIQMEHDIHCVGLPRLIAHKREPKQTAHVEKVPEVASKQDVLLAQCDYCKQLFQPFVHSELLENATDFQRLFCCEKAKQMRELIMAEKEKLAQKESDRKIDVNPGAPMMSEEERKVAKEQAKERLRLLQLQRKPTKDNLNKDLSHIEIKNTTSYRLSKEIPCINPQKDIKNTTDMFTLQEETDGNQKPKDVLKKFYKSGECFLTLCPDGTGNVFYPSGNAAMIISSAEAADFTYIILDDKDAAPSIKGIFTNRGHSTCYHPNGTMWLNLTPVGGLCFSEMGALNRRWNWLYRDPNVHNLPFKPLTLALGPHISVCIHSQERMYIKFAHQQNNVHFNVGSKLEHIYPESCDKPRQDVLERYAQMKRSEIYSLLDQMQTCMSRHSASLSNIKPHYRFTAQKQRLSREMEKEKSPEKIKAHVN
ncbi:glutamate-rich protein 6-like isoform X2 [Centropristis striata]|uniref:glutamate-rich protein 6-like isoform X2 n=1 Tax=Centropristis striata TaxID=184440 RepID=UPI0027DF8701|nr:glutamate-rich protein 6-like isoform X2 [Centropristis striata]